MNTILCVVAALHLSFFERSVPPAILQPSSGVAAGGAETEAIPQLVATTRSVVKRRVELNGTITLSAEAPVTDTPQARRRATADFPEDQVVQASFQKTESQKNSAPRGAARGAPKGTTPSPNQAADDSTGARNNVTDRATGGASDLRSNDGAKASNGTPPPASLDPATRAAGNASAVLLASALTASEEDKLEGRPLPLVEALGQTAAGRQRLEIASLYWKLALASADYNWAHDELHQWEALPANPGAVDAPLFSTARAAAHARMLEAKAAAVTMQQELADALGQSTSAMPLVVEQPLVGAYRTHFDTIFSGRTPPGRSRAIDRGLPLWREAIDLRTAAVQAATSAVQSAEAAYGEKNAAAETVIYAHRELSQQRRAFLSAVREYNAEIVEYASYVAGPNTSTATLVGMLTRPKPITLNDGAGASTPGSPHEPTLANPALDPNVSRASGVQEIGDDSWQADDAGQIDSNARGDAGAPSEPQTRLKAVDGGGRD